MGTRTALALLLVVALACRLGVVAATPNYRLPPPGYDPPAYDSIAASIARTGAFPTVGGHPSATFPPAYPYFLGGLYAISGAAAPDRWEVARIAQALLGTVAVVLIGLIAWQLWGRRASFAALGLAAVYPPLIIVGATLLTEALFVPLELGAVAAALQYRRSPQRLRWALLAGVLAGLAALTRVNVLLMLPPLLLAVWPSPRRSARSAVPVVGLLLAGAVTVSPWMIRNAVELHAFIPLATQGAGLAGIFNDTSRTTSNHRAAFRPPQQDPHDAALLARSAHLGEVALYHRLVGDARRYALHHPGYVVEVGVLNTLRLLHLYDRGYARATARDIGIPGRLADIGRWSFYPVALLALAGAFTAAARRTPLWFWLMPVLLMGTVFIGGFPRFRAPVDPFIVMLAALALASGWRRLRAAT